MYIYTADPADPADPAGPRGAAAGDTESLAGVCAASACMAPLLLRCHHELSAGRRGVFTARLQGLQGLQGSQGVQGLQGLQGGAASMGVGDGSERGRGGEAGGEGQGWTPRGGDAGAARGDGGGDADAVVCMWWICSRCRVGGIGLCICSRLCACTVQ